MKVCFQAMSGPRKEWEGPELTLALAGMLEATAHPRFHVTDRPEDADVILLMESNHYKDRSYLEVMRVDATLASRPNDCFTINYEDDAVGFLAGLYAGLPQERFDPLRHRATCYLLPPNPMIEDFAAKRLVTKPRHLFSFRGAASHPLRDGVFARRDEWQKHGPILRVDRWFDHTLMEKQAYFEEILDSKFVLCPRGIAPVSHRLFEVMQMGRVPVILADAWVAPQGPDWASCSIRLAESRLKDLPQLLTGHAMEWEDMAHKAREAWENWFSPERKLVHALTLVEDLMHRRPAGYSESVELRRWGSTQQRWKMGWTLPQRAVRRLKRRLMRGA